MFFFLHSELAMDSMAYSRVVSKFRTCIYIRIKNISTFESFFFSSSVWICLCPGCVVSGGAQPIKMTESRNTRSHQLSRVPKTHACVRACLRLLQCS